MTIKHTTTTTTTSTTTSTTTTNNNDLQVEKCLSGEMALNWGARRPRCYLLFKLMLESALFTLGDVKSYMKG